MTYYVGQNLFGGFFVVVSVNTETGETEIASQVLGGPGGPFTTTIVPETTVAVLQAIVDAAAGKIPG